MRSTLSLMFMTLACIIAFTIAQPEILETSSDAGESEAISSVAGISLLQEAENEKYWATKSLLYLITMQMEAKITYFLYNTSPEDLRSGRKDNLEYFRQCTMTISRVMTIVKKMVEVKIKPNPDSTKEGIQKQEEDLLNKLHLLLTKILSTDLHSSLIDLVKGYTSDGKIEPVGLLYNQVMRRRDASTHVSGRAIASQGVKVKVIRNGGHVWIITEAELVRDDIILVERGQIVPADCRVIWSMGLKVDELSLTGVSDHVEKSADDVSKMVPNDCRTYKNLIMKGSTVTEGEGLAIVLAPQGVKVKVIRNGGHVWDIPEAELVPDDIILVERGQIVPADCRVIWSMDLKVDELSLTGVSNDVEKSADDVSKMMPNGCRTYKNLIMKGSTVIGGEGLAIVFGTDMNTREGLYQKQQMENSMLVL